MGRVAAARIEGGRLVSSFALVALAAASAAPVAAVVALGSAGGSVGDLPTILLSTLGQPRFLKSLGFTLSQALASTLAALVVGLPGAALVARYRFPGRRALKALSVFPFSMPSVLVALAFVLYYGKSGFLNRVLMQVLGLSEPPIGFLYSFWGIVLVHGFYEFPLVLQIVGEAWSALPRETERAARTLGAGRLRSFATGTLPSLAPALAHSAGIVFLLCFFSFAVVMIFGGLAGSTLEVEVYRRARFEADPSGAAAVALAETLVALAVVAAISLADRRSAALRSAGSPPELEKPRGAAALAIAAYAAFLGLFFAGPMAALVAQAFSVRGGPLGPESFGLGNFARILSGPGAPFAAALADTASTAVPAALIATVMGSLGALALRRRGPLVKAASALPLAVSGIVASLGWSLLFPSGGNALVPLAQAIGALPYVLKSVASSLASLERSPVEAARTLGAGRVRAAVGVELRGAAPAVGAAFAFALAVAAGDINAPLVLGRGGYEPLPVLLYRLIGAYRLQEACAVGVLLGAISSLAFFLNERRRPRA
jgi:thiamine transport system permease protein